MTTTTRDIRKSNRKPVHRYCVDCKQWVFTLVPDRGITSKIVLRPGTTSVHHRSQIRASQLPARGLGTRSGYLCDACALAERALENSPGARSQSEAGPDNGAAPEPPVGRGRT